MSKNTDNETIAEQHKIIGNTLSSSHSTFCRTTHPDAQWYGNAGLGLFIHWGISSVSGQYDLSWGMMNRAPGFYAKNVDAHGLPACSAGVTPNHYWAQAPKFTADKYDPDKWLKAAKEAGMTYCVLTTKHHDGFALWPSEYGEFNTKNFLNGRDLVGEYVEACRRNDIKIGFYYSPPDWYLDRHHMSFNYGDTEPLGLDHEPITLPVLSKEEQEAREDALNDYVRGQVRELLTRYGSIDIIWFDGNLPRKEETISINEIRELQPGILINPRGHGYGDFDTPECRFPTKRFAEDQWWELCYVFSDGAWGYLNHECYKPIGWLLSNFSQVRGWGGNFLPNVGPDGHGELPRSFYLRMEQLATWMKHSGESVRGTTAGEWPEQCNVPVTRKDSTLYLHLDWLFSDKVVLKDVDEPSSLIHLRTGSAVSFHYQDRILSFTFDKNLKTIETDVVKVSFE